MGFTKKTWKNRIAEYINRRLITMEDGSTNLVTVARDEGTISQEGDAFNAANMNDLEDRIEAGFADVSQSLTKLNNKGLKALNSNYAAYYYKNGNTVYIVADFANKTVPQNGVTLGTLPIGYRPYVEVYGRNGFDNQNGEMMVNRSGVVKLQSASGSFNYGHFSCCFPCTDTL